MFSPYIVNDPKGQAQRQVHEVNGQKKFYFIFQTFARDTTLLHLIFISKVKR
jgi:hypothetical protein